MCTISLCPTVFCFFILSSLLGSCGALSHRWRVSKPPHVGSVALAPAFMLFSLKPGSRHLGPGVIVWKGSASASPRSELEPNCGRTSVTTAQQHSATGFLTSSCSSLVRGAGKKVRMTTRSLVSPKSTRFAHGGASRRVPQCVVFAILPLARVASPQDEENEIGDNRYESDKEKESSREAADEMHEEDEEEEGGRIVSTTDAGASVTKPELVSALAAATGVSKSSVEKIVETLPRTVAGYLVSGRKVTLTKLGAFGAKRRPARTARNPRTNEAVHVEETLAPTFSFSRTMKELVRQQAAAQQMEEEL